MFFNKIVKTIFDNHYLKVFHLNIIRGGITEYDVVSGEVQREVLYKDWVNEIAENLQYMDIQLFMEQMNQKEILSHLNLQGNSYIVCYNVKAGQTFQSYQLVFCFADETCQSLLITLQDISTYMRKHMKKMNELQKDSERFRFVISNLCENFGEIDTKTGEIWMTTSADWVVENGTFKEQIDWFADNMIVPEQREAYRKDFEMENFIDSLHKNKGFYAPTYAANYPDGMRYLLIINALLANPLNPSEEYIFGFAQDITQLKIQEEKNKQLIDISEKLFILSQIEPVTELLNRITGEKKIEEYLHTSKIPGTFLLADIDYFKKFNDTYGHAVGDVVLKFMSETLRSTFYSYDILCRWGGDEFVIFLPHQNNLEQIQTQVKRLQEKMINHRYRSSSLPITLSIGGVIVQQGITLSAVFNEADKLLYQVKQAGRNNVQISTIPISGID